MYALAFSHKPATVEDEKGLYDFEMSPSSLYKL